jgi:hypothetical protein
MHKRRSEIFTMAKAATGVEIHREHSPVGSAFAKSIAWSFGLSYDGSLPAYCEQSDTKL